MFVCVYFLPVCVRFCNTVCLSTFCLCLHLLYESVSLSTCSHMYFRLICLPIDVVSVSVFVCVVSASLCPHLCVCQCIFCLSVYASVCLSVYFLSVFVRFCDTVCLSIFCLCLHLLYGYVSLSTCSHMYFRLICLPIDVFLCSFCFSSHFCFEYMTTHVHYRHFLQRSVWTSTLLLPG